MRPILYSVLLFVPFALTARYLFVCQTLHWCGGGAEAIALNEGTPPPTELAYPDGTPAVELALGAYVPNAAELPRSPALSGALDLLARVVRGADSLALYVDGPYRPGERRPDRFADLGVARAAALASELQRRGIDSDQLVLGSVPAGAGERLSPRLAFGPREPHFALPAAWDPRDELPDSLALHGLRFATGSSALSPNAEFAEYAAALVEALDARPDRTLRLVGHTDDRAETAYNDTLGLRRAAAVARYLGQLGYRGDIAVETRGERDPLGDNATPDGRYLNRRVEVRIE